MAHELEKTVSEESGNTGKVILNRRGYVKAGVTLAAIVGGSGIGLIDSTSAGETTESFNTGFGEYVK